MEKMDFILKSVTRSSDPAPISDLKTNKGPMAKKRTSAYKTISASKTNRGSKENPGWCQRKKE